MSLTKKECAECGQSFLSSRSNHRFCKDHCRIRAHRAKHKVLPEVKQAKTSIFEFYKQVISQLDDDAVVRTAMSLLIEPPEENSQRKESKLYTFAKQQGLVHDAL